MEFKWKKSVGFIISKLGLRFKADINRRFQERGFDITLEQWGILKCLWEEEGISQTEIAYKLSMDKASITRILDIMQKNKLITRCNDEFDRRSYRILLTDEGKSLKGKLIAIVSDTNNRVCQCLTEDEIRELQRLLLKLASNYK